MRERRPGWAVANAFFFAGYSQGGHAAFVARDFAPRYAPELGVKGAIAYGGRGDVVTLLSEFPALGPYLLYAYSTYYGTDKVDPAQAPPPALGPHPGGGRHQHVHRRGAGLLRG